MSKTKRNFALVLLVVIGIYFSKELIFEVLVDQFHNPGSAQECYKTAEVLYRGRSQAGGPEYARCITWCNKTLSHDPRHAAAYVLRGRAQRALENSAEAIADFNKAFEIDPACEAGSLLQETQRRK